MEIVTFSLLRIIFKSCHYAWAMKTFKLLQVFLPWLSHPFKWRLQPTHQEKYEIRKAVMEELGKVIKNKDVSLETKDNTIHTLILPITTYRCERWTVIGEKLIHLKDGVGAELDGYPGPKERYSSGFYNKLSLKEN